MDTALRYKINGYEILIKKRRDGYYTARVLTPRSISIGRTPQEALKKLAETIELCGEYYRLEVM